MKKLFVISFILTLISSCSDKEDTDSRIIFDNIITYKSDFEHPDGYIIRTWADTNYIYISSAPDFRIHIYNYQGNKINTLGKKGPSPSENDALWYFCIDETKNRYWVHDYSKQMLKLFNLESDSLLTYRKIITLNNVHYFGKDKFVIPRFIEGRKGYFLSIFDTEKQSYIKNYDLLKIMDNVNLKNSNYLDFVFEGDFCNNNHFVVYYCISTGIFFVLNTSDFSIKIIKDVRSLPTPKPFLRNQEIQLNPKQVASISATMDEKYLYSLSTKKASDIRRTGKFQVDVYDLSLSKYIGSFELQKRNGDETPRRISIVKDRFFVQFGNEIVSTYDIDIKKLKTDIEK